MKSQALRQGSHSNGGVICSGVHIHTLGNTTAYDPKSQQMNAENLARRVIDGGGSAVLIVGKGQSDCRRALGQLRSKKGVKLAMPYYNTRSWRFTVDRLSWSSGADLFRVRTRDITN